jgi:hypothetical protein
MPFTRTILSNSSHIRATARAMPSPRSSTRWAVSALSSSVSKLQNIAPKLRACVISWLKQKAKTNPASASLLPNVFQPQMARHSFVVSPIPGAKRRNYQYVTSREPIGKALMSRAVDANFPRQMSFIFWTGLVLREKLGAASWNKRRLTSGRC